MSLSVKQLVFDYLAKQGMQPRLDEDNDIIFNYNGRHFYFSDPGTDESFFNLVLPHICDVTEETREAILTAANTVNMQMKLAKASVHDTWVNLSIELFVDTDPEMDELIPRFLTVLIDAQQAFDQLTIHIFK